MPLMTQADYARHRGVGKPAVSNWKKAGLLVLAEDPADGKIKVDRDRTDAKLNAKLDPMRGRPSTGHSAPEPAIDTPRIEPALPLDQAGSAPSAAAPDFNAERVEELRERRIGAALKNALTAGDLVPLIEAERRVAEVGRVARERMQSWLRGMAERFAATADVRSIMAIGEEGIDEVFAELAAAALRGDFAAEEEEEVMPEEEAALEASVAE